MVKKSVDTPLTAGELKDILTRIEKDQKKILTILSNAHVYGVTKRKLNKLFGFLKKGE